MAKSEPRASRGQLRHILANAFMASDHDLSDDAKLIFNLLLARDVPVAIGSLTNDRFRTHSDVLNSILALNVALRSYFKTTLHWTKLEIAQSGSSLTRTFHLRETETLSNDKNTAEWIGEDKNIFITPSIKQALGIGSHRVFLCHSSGDRAKVRELHMELRSSGFTPWLDEEDLVPGTRWEPEIRKAVKQSDIVLVCLSKSSITKEGFVQKEIKIALDFADEKPDDTIYIIPARLEECPLPERLNQWHCVDLFREGGFDKLVRAIRSKPINTHS
jgi:hypothetical protein